MRDLRDRKEASRGKDILTEDLKAALIEESEQRQAVVEQKQAAVNDKKQCEQRKDYVIVQVKRACRAMKEKERNAEEALASIIEVLQRSEYLEEGQSFRS